MVMKQRCRTWFLSMSDGGESNKQSNKKWFLVLGSGWLLMGCLALVDAVAGGDRPLWHGIGFLVLGVATLARAMGYIHRDG